MAINTSSLTTTTTAISALSGLVLVSPQKVVGYQPKLVGPFDTGLFSSNQPPRLLFHYEGEQSVDIESDITDHYIEDNTAIQDQIALRPERVKTTGFIGELNDVAPFPLSVFKTTTEKLLVVSAYTPELTRSALIAYNTAFQLYQVAANARNAAVAAVSSIGNAFFGKNSDQENTINSGGLGEAFDPFTASILGNQNKQQVMFQQFYGYWRNRTLFTVQTPWAIFDNMAIEKLHPVQDEDTRLVTRFEITFKMIRTASTANTSGIAITLQGRAATQNAAEVNLGTGSTGTETSFDSAVDNTESGAGQ